MSLSAEEYAKIQSFPIKLKAKAVVNFGYRRIANGDFVVVVYHSVFIIVQILDIAGTYRAEFLFGTEIDFILIFEQS